MLYIYIASNDPSGEGERACLEKFETQDAADKFWEQTLLNDKDSKDITEMSMIIGTCVDHYQIGQDIVIEANQLTDGELRQSAIEDVPDLDNKENL